MAFAFRAQMDGATVEPDHAAHDGCACITLVSTLPASDRVFSDYESIEAAEQHGWAILQAVEAIRATRAAQAVASEAVHQHG